MYKLIFPWQMGQQLTKLSGRVYTTTTPPYMTIIMCHSYRGRLSRGAWTPPAIIVCQQGKNTYNEASIVHIYTKCVYVSLFVWDVISKCCLFGSRVLRWNDWLLTDRVSYIDIFHRSTIQVPPSKRSNLQLSIYICLN